MTPLRQAASRGHLLGRRLRKDRLLRNSAIYLAGSLGAGSLNYVFHFVTGHLLGPASYGVVASAVAALYLLTLPALVIQITSMRFTSVFNARDEGGAIRRMLHRLAVVGAVVGGAAALFLVLAASSVQRFLQISDRRVVLLLAGSTLIALLVSANRGALQGLRRFVALSLNLVLDGGSRVLLALLLLALGFGPLGAIGAVLLSPLIAYGQTLWLLRKTGGPSTGETMKLTALATYAGPTSIAVIGITYIFNLDILLAKHYLPPRQAGIYASAAVLARVIHFLGVALASVMFPEVATLHAKNERHYHVVDSSLIVLGTLSAGFVIIYFLAPGIVLLPYGQGFTDVKPYLAPFAVALGLLALANLLVSYFMSIDSRRFVLPLLLACALETVLITYFHRSLSEILAMLLITVATLTLSLGIIYFLERAWGSRVDHGGEAPISSPGQPAIQ